MADEQSEQPNAPEPLAPQQEWTRPDWFLQTLVTLSNSCKGEIGMTLQIGGFLVSGIMVSGTQYFDAFAKEFASGFADKDLAEQVRTHFSGFGEIYKAKADVPDPAFIHLVNARFFNTSGQPIPANRGVLWRGRLSEVSGFIVGTLAEGQGGGVPSTKNLPRGDDLRGPGR
jgi:hypothetical protein